MPCYHPLKGYRSMTVNPSGKRSIVFKEQEGYKDLPVEMSCGQCIGCRLARSSSWAVRIMHEASLYEENSFLTLTYDDAHLPARGSLQKKDFQDFMKRLRKHASVMKDRKVRFFHCGEYGDRFSRPHYHACVFNWDFSDKKLAEERRGEKYFESERLNKLWGKGLSRIGNVTFESAAYVARYIVKKVTGPRSEWFYEGMDEETGEFFRMEKEYVTMSRRPGIGKEWFERYKSDVFPGDYVVVNGRKVNTPKFYLSLLEKAAVGEYELIKARRLIGKDGFEVENTPERLRVRESLQLARLELLKRGYEDGT